MRCVIKLPTVEWPYIYVAETHTSVKKKNRREYYITYATRAQVELFPLSCEPGKPTRRRVASGGLVYFRIITRKNNAYNAKSTAMNASLSTVHVLYIFLRYNFLLENTNWVSHNKFYIRFFFLYSLIRRLVYVILVLIIYRLNSTLALRAIIYWLSLWREWVKNKNSWRTGRSRYYSHQLYIPPLFLYIQEFLSLNI